ncbi:sugar phosphate isomerase/epimerase [Paenibacillus rhizovicinus]|uniref:Sugar phosphate isomerase/epimerase n=1 Tax=Paenibacillus rhizovicinus TaxID=2704463 RepID=A0A6C0P650_9BACL|nr:TIM barrel protein [Paenibacillus rhizovicinus]QHW32092.1 sugar phosphate isomerase/epimerase [Paenibacillus rhizovicinus]
MKYLRLKGNLEQRNVDNRLSYNPDIIEFYLSEQDLESPDLIRDRIRQLHKRGVKPYLHHPPKFQGEYLDILSSNPAVRRYYHESSELLARICKEERAKCIIHAHYTHTESCHYITRERTVRLREEIREILTYARDVFLWEDSTAGLFAYGTNPYLVDELIVPLELPLNVDVSHAFISCGGDNERLQHVLERTKPYAEYYHLVDSMGIEHDSLSLGQGRIDWRMVKPLVLGKDFIFEITLAGDHSDCTPMVDSARYFANVETADGIGVK